MQRALTTAEVEPERVAESRSTTASLVGPVFWMRFVGSAEGCEDGCDEGWLVGMDGLAVGSQVGFTEGIAVGTTVGAEGIADGA